MKGGNWVVGVVDGVRVSSAGMEKRRRGAAGRINKKQSKSRLDLIEMSSQRDEIDI